MRRLIFLAMPAIVISGCTNMRAEGGQDAAGRAELRDTNGNAVGRATLLSTATGARLTVEASGMQPGEHGLHVHAVGKCDAPDFASAGPHWNPTSKMHGRDNPMGAHQGDLPNIVIAQDGRGTLSFYLPGSPATLFDADGSAIVVHAAADDYRTDPSGNSGGRIACGVLTAG